MREHIVYDDAQVQKTFAHSFTICTIDKATKEIDSLFGILGKEFQCLLANKLVGNAFQFFLGGAFYKGLVDNLIARIPCDVARDKLAVHADSLARNSILLGLQLCDLLETLVE